MEGESGLRDFLKTDIAARIIALVIAIIVWIYVVVLLDPFIDIRISDIPVIYTNTVNLTNENFVLLNDKPSTVSIKIRGSRTMLAKVNKNDITAYVDLDGYNRKGEFSLPVSVRLPYEGLIVTEKKPYSLNVKIDKLTTQSFPVTVEFIGTPDEGFEVYKPVVSHETVEIKGPSDIVTEIEKVVALVDVDGVRSDVVSNKPLVFYNTNADVVGHKYLSATPEKVEVRCTVLARKELEVKAVLEDGDDKYTATILTGSRVIVLGKPEDLKSVTEIRTLPIRVKNIKQSTKVAARLDLPPGVVVEGVTDVTVDISVKNDEN
ncbi:MAG: YbbR-like protein [Firmicutes bacterium ADurb.Bin193]|nr:MAG: YbbR-like protein [Firmicutes bacterium ADurb.Bin193]